MVLCNSFIILFYIYIYTVHISNSIILHHIFHLITYHCRIYYQNHHIIFVWTLENIIIQYTLYMFIPWFISNWYPNHCHPLLLLQAQAPDMCDFFGPLTSMSSSGSGFRNPRWKVENWQIFCRWPGDAPTNKCVLRGLYMLSWCKNRLSDSNVQYYIGFGGTSLNITV